MPGDLGRGGARLAATQRRAGEAEAADHEGPRRWFRHAVDLRGRGEIDAIDHEVLRREAEAPVFEDERRGARTGSDSRRWAVSSISSNSRRIADWRGPVGVASEGRVEGWPALWGRAIGATDGW